MTFTHRPAKREKVWVMVSLAGGTSSGKTMSAMLLAKGMAGGKPFAYVDTENRRALHYADQFDFEHGSLTAPFRPEAYAEAVETYANEGHSVIVVDSMSHEWDGDGGVLDFQEDEYARLGSRESAKMLSWQEPKKAHRKMLTRLLQVNAHLILCFRAADKIEMAKVDGKTVVRPKQSLTGLDGWVPICEPRLPFEMTASFLLMADAPGVPRPIKMPEHFKPLIRLDGPLGEGAGERLAAWAAGKPAAKAVA